MTPSELRDKKAWKRCTKCKRLMWVGYLMRQHPKCRGTLLME